MVNQDSREFFYFKVPVFLADLVLHIGILAFFLKFLPSEKTYGFKMDVGLLSLLAISFSTSIAVIGLRLHERRIRPNIVVWRAARQTLLTYMLFAVLVAMVYKTIPDPLIIRSFLTALLVLCVWHYLANRLVKTLRKLGRNTRHVILVGADETLGSVCSELLKGGDITGYVVRGYFSSLEIKERHMPDCVDYLGDVDALYRWLEVNRPDEIYCSLQPDRCQEDVSRIIKWCNDNFVDFYFVPTMDGYPHRKMSIRDFGSVTVFKLRDEPLNNPMSKIAKRLLDIIISSVFLLTLYPFVFLFVWIGDMVSGSKGPVYFRQARTGYNGKSFKIYKFRSMKVNDQADTLQATEDDPRKTKFGDFLRRTSIDELPQFINVLIGDMSIVGPRPHMEHHTEIYSGLISDYMVRHLAKPGITGWAQVNGCRGETKTLEDMESRVKHDIWYIEHWTLFLDAEIVLKTCWQVLPGHDKQAY